MAPVAAVVSLTAGMLGAVPAQAAVRLPAGCITYDQPETYSEVNSLECKVLTSSATFTQFPKLQSLTIGPEDSYDISRVSITELPALPPSLMELSINAPKVKSFKNVAKSKNLTRLTLMNGTKGLDLKTLVKSAPHLVYIYIGEASPIDYSPLGKIKNLQFLNVSGTLAPQKSVERRWVKANFPVGLNGKHVLPTNSDVIGDNGKKTSKEYTYDAKSKKIRWNVGHKGRQFVKFDPKPAATKAQPRLQYAGFFFDGSLNVSSLSEWEKDKKTTLKVTGTALVGKTVTAKLSNPHKSYIDKYQWNRNGKPIKGATKASYKLVKADAGKKITVTATDLKDSFGFTGAMFPSTHPYSVTKTATNKALYGFATKKPTISGTAKVGKKFVAKTAKWGGSPSKYSYQWLRNGKAIKGATKSSYKLVKADCNKKVAVKVTGSKKNYQTASSTSASKTVR